jgi:hypothetical protein
MQVHARKCACFRWIALLVVGLAFTSEILKTNKKIRTAASEKHTPGKATSKFKVLAELLLKDLDCEGRMR